MVDELLNKGYHVRVLDNLDPQVHGDAHEKKSWPSYCNQGAEYLFGDVCNRATVHKALRQIDIVFHLAAAVGVGQSMYRVQHYVDTNINGTATLLDIVANENDVRDRMQKLIVASSMSNYGEGEYLCPIHGQVYPQSRSRSQLDSGQWELLCKAKIGQNQECGKILQPISTREDKPLHANSIYAITKKTQEEMVLTIGETYRIPSVALRFFNTYGTRQAYQILILEWLPTFLIAS